MKIAAALLVVTACATGDDATQLANAAGDKGDRAATTIRLTNDPDGAFASFVLLCEEAAGCNITIDLDVRDMYAVKDDLAAAGNPVTQSNAVDLVKVHMKGPLATDLEWDYAVQARMKVDAECPEGCIVGDKKLDLPKQPKGSYLLELTKTDLAAVASLRLQITAAWYAANQ